MKREQFEKQVIQALLEKGGALRASELEKIVTEKTGIVYSTFYKRLAKLIEKGLLVKDRSKWRSSIYRLNLEAIPQKFIHLPLMKQEILSSINETMQPFETRYMKGEINEAGFLRELNLRIAGLSAWALLKQIETGEPYVDVVSYYLSEGAQTLLKRTIIQKETPYLENKKRGTLFLSDVAFGLLPEYQSALDRYEKALNDLYSEVKEYEACDARVSEGKSRFKLIGIKTVEELKETQTKLEKR